MPGDPGEFDQIGLLRSIKALLGGSATGAKTGSNSLSVVPASDALFKVAGAGIYATASFTPIAAAYTANDVMGTAQEFVFTYGDGTAIPTGSLIRILTSILRVDQTALQTAEGAYQLQGYSVTPPSAFADNAAWTRTSADLPSSRGLISLGTPVDEGASCYVKSSSIDLDIRLTGVSMFAYLQTLAGVTIGATPANRQVTLYGIVL